LWLAEAGIDFLNKDQTKAVFNTPRAVEVLKFWTDLYKSGLAPSEALTASHRRPIELYKTGQLAILSTGPQFLNQIKSDTPDIFAKTDVGPLLHWKDDYRYIIPLHCLAISSKTEHPKEAAEFAAFVTSGPKQIEFAKRVTILPSVTESLNDPYFTQPEDTLEGRSRAIMADIVEQGIVSKAIPHAPKILSMLDEITESVALGKVTAEEGLDKAEERVNEILQEE
jgi:ABC-type glycerol-3-phosphate transport system substrate-binding protein